MHSSRASVTQQVLPLPLILGRNESSASKASSTKRDSAIGLGGFVRKISLKRPTSQSPSHETMAPVYRLVRYVTIFAVLSLAYTRLD